MEFKPHTVEALNTQTGEVEALPNDQAFEAYKTGLYKFRDTDEFKVFDEFGAPKTIKAAGLESALSQNWRPATDAEQKEYFLQKEYGDREVTAAGLGVARGLTARLSDVALTKLGLMEPEAIKEITERSPWAAGVGEAAAIIAPLIATGGASAAAQAGAKGTAAAASKFTAPYLISKIGQAGEAAVAKPVSWLTSKLAARGAAEALASTGVSRAASRSVARLIAEQAVPRAFGGAVEGAVYGTGQAISEAALGDSELNAEALLSTVGPAALIGGGLSFGASAVGIGLKRAGERLAARFGVKPAEEIIEEQGERFVSGPSGTVDTKPWESPGKGWPGDVTAPRGTHGDVLNNYQKVYRGNYKRTSPIEGVWSTSKNPDVAKNFSDTGEIEEFFLPKDSKVIDISTLRKKILGVDEFPDPSSLTKEQFDSITGESLIKRARELGYDVIDQSGVGIKSKGVSATGKMLDEEELKILNPEILKKKDQIIQTKDIMDSLPKTEIPEGPVVEKAAGPVKVKVTMREKNLARDLTTDPKNPVKPEEVIRFEKDPSAFEMGTERIPTLDENAAGKVTASKAFLDDMDKLETIKDQMEEGAQNLIEQSGVTMSADDLKTYFEDQIQAVNKEFDIGEGRQAIVSRMKNYIQEIDDAVERTGSDTLTAPEIRKTMQSLRNDNKRFYAKFRQPGSKMTPEEIALNNVTKDIDEFLKGKDATGKIRIPGYKEHMEPYAQLMRTREELRRHLRWNSQSESPTIFNWMQNRVATHIQKAYEGYASRQADLIKEFSDIVGRDWKTVIENNLIYAKMFPAEAAESQKGTISSQVLKGILRHPIQTAKEALIDIAIEGATTGEAPTIVREARRRAAQEILKTGDAERKIGFLSKASEIVGKQFRNANDALKYMLSEPGQRSFVPASVNAIMTTAYKPNAEKPKSRRDAILVRRGELSELATNPQALIERMAPLTGPMSEVAPNIASAMQQKTATAVKYLHDSIPKDPSTGQNLFEDPKRFEPSDSDISKFERRLHAIENPLSILEDARSGTVTPESVEAVKVVYPKLYDAMKAQTMALVVEQKKQIPYQTRVQLSILFGAPMDSTMRPEFIKAMQQPVPQAQAKSTARPGMISKAESMSTGIQRREMR